MNVQCSLDKNKPLEPTLPYLIDGNNLLHAMTEPPGRLGLCQLLAERFGGQDVCVAFDGPPPPTGLAEQVQATGVSAVYCPDRPADTEVLARIAADSAPKQLVVVSTDREIRQAASRRRCRVIRSEEFARLLESPAPPPRSPRDRSEKPRTLTPEETEAWLREFGIE